MSSADAFASVSLEADWRSRSRLSALSSWRGGRRRHRALLRGRRDRAGSAPRTGPAPAGLEEEKVLATGESPVAGPWQISGYESDQIVDQGEVLQPAGLPCLRILLVERQVSPLGGSGYCGSSRDFKVASVPASDGKDVEVLLWGPAPEEAATVELRAAGGIKHSAPVHDGPPEYEGDLWVIPASHTLEDASVVWLGGDGRVSAPQEASTSLQRGESVAAFLRELRERGELPE